MKTILIGFKHGAKPQTVLNNVATTNTKTRGLGDAALKMERLHSIASEITDVKTRALGKSDDDVFDELVYPTKADFEQRIYRTYKVNLPDSVDADAVMSSLEADSSVEFVQFDELNEMYFVPNDPKLASMYGMTKIQATAAWDLSQGAGVKVAVLDTGVDYNHNDINTNVLAGFDFSDNDGDPMDTFGHGTHVAGTIAAVTNNARGIAGVAPQAKIMPVKIFPNAFDSVCATALKWAVDKGAKVLNNSWGPRNRRPSNPVVEAAIDYVYSKGGICVFAAGNNGDDVAFFSPANHPRVITVGATDSADARASFSQWGAAVDIAAPGVNIESLQRATNGYYFDSGTSMAAPHVSGVIALLAANRGNITFEEAKAAIFNGGNVITTDKPISGRRLNAYGALVAAGSYWVTKRIQGLWTNSSERNAYAYIESVGWKRIAGQTDAIHQSMLAQLISAKENGRAVGIFLSNHVISQIYN